MADLTLPDELVHHIRSIAEQEKRSVGDVVETMVEQYLARKTLTQNLTEKIEVAANPLTLANSDEGSTTPDFISSLPVFGSYPPGTLQLISIENIDQIAALGKLEFPEDRVTGIYYSPDGKYLAIRLETKVVLWDMHTSQQYAVLEHNKWIETLAFSPDGKSLIVSAGNVLGKTISGSKLHYWDVATAQEVYTWTPQVGFVNAIAFNPQNPEIIALMSMERELIGNNGMRPFNAGIELWDGTNLIQRYTDFRQFYSEGYNKLNDRLLEFGHDGKTIFVCLFNSDGLQHGGQVIAWEALGSGSLQAITDKNACFFEMKLNRQGNHLAVSNAPEGKLSVHDIESGAVVYSHIDTEQLPYQLEFDSTGNILAVGRNPKNRTEGRIDLINLTRSEKIWELPINHVGDIAFSPNNTLLAVEITGNRKSGNQAIVFWGIPR